MKTKLIATLILSCMTIGLAGCAGKAPENLSEIAEKVVINTEKQKSYVANVDCDLDFKMVSKNEWLDLDLDIVLGAEIELRENNGSNYTKGTMSLGLIGMNETAEIEQYAIKNNLSSMIYEKQSDGQWTAKLNVEEEENIFDEEQKEESIQELINLLKTHDLKYEKTDVKKINGEKVWYYKGSVPMMDLLKNNMVSDATEDYIGIGTDATDGIMADVNIELYIYADDLLPAKITIKLPEKIETFDENGNGTAFNELYLDVEMSQYGMVEDIVVPEEIEEKTISYQTWMDKQMETDDEWEEDNEWSGSDGSDAIESDIENDSENL